MKRVEYDREVYDHERQTGQHTYEEDGFVKIGESLDGRIDIVVRPEKETLATYTIQILSPDLTPEETRWSLSDQRVLSNLPAMIESVGEDLSDLLPDGYSCRIKEWSDDSN